MGHDIELRKRNGEKSVFLYVLHTKFMLICINKLLRHRKKISFLPHSPSIWNKKNNSIQFHVKSYEMCLFLDLFVVVTLVKQNCTSQFWKVLPVEKEQFFLSAADFDEIFWLVYIITMEKHCAVNFEFGDLNTSSICISIQI